MEASVITLKDNLTTLVQDINDASWDDDNEISGYTEESLHAYLERQDTIFVTCYELADAKRTLLGIASARIEIKPYGRELWLYVDEVDVCSNHRQKGAGKLIMRKLMAVAK